MAFILRNCFSKFYGSSKLFFVKTRCLEIMEVRCFNILSQSLYNYPNQIYFYSTDVKSNSSLSSCGKLRLSDVGDNVVIRGFLHYSRMGQFFTLRDSYGSIQIILNEKSEELEHIPIESYLEVEGTVSARPKGQVNPKMKTGEIEVSVKANKMKVINEAKNIPFLIRDHNRAKESLGLKYRYLDLRQSHLQDNLRLRSVVCKKMRDYLQDVENFIEITTPTLSRNTPGGAQEFVVPTQSEGMYYSLVQSPQIFKQLAVIGGFEKYFQFAICYRDEGAKPDRQPEFMQLDLEMANASMVDVMKLTKGILCHSWPNRLPPLKNCSFPQINYSEAMEDYGVDKPDTRFEWKLVDLTDILVQSDSSTHSDILSLDGNICKSFLIPGGKAHLKQKIIDSWQYVATIENNLNGVSVWNLQGDTLKGPLTKNLGKETKNEIISRLKMSPEDALIVASGPRKDVLGCLGRLRVLGADLLESSGVKVRSETFNFLWVVNFPLFEKGENGELISCHHPFTSPQEKDIPLLYSDPENVISQHYDLVLNGSEIGGGSIRIHNRNIQEYILNTILKESSKDMDFLLNALDSGAPPHGGIALGFDRYLSMIIGCSSIRDVVAFPKTTGGKCLMSGAPVLLNSNDRLVYGIK